MQEAFDRPNNVELNQLIAAVESGPNADLDFPRSERRTQQAEEGDSHRNLHLENNASSLGEYYEQVE